MNLLEVRGLTTAFMTGRGEVNAIEDVSFTLKEGEILGIVGESGSGKSVTALTVMDLLPKPPARVAAGEVVFNGQVLTRMTDREMQRIRGPGISMIFQEPMTSLNPVFSIGDQIMETIAAHERLSQSDLRKRAIGMLDKVGIPSAARRLDDYPHQMSGGQRQRVMIAMALACNPKLLIADEPTTALDVTIQAQILDLLMDLRDEFGMAIMIITHNMGVIAETADRVAVMYAGRVVEIGPVTEVVRAPAHPYTRGLMGAIPVLGAEVERLVQIDGAMPRLDAIPPGCAFHPRCSEAFARCRVERPALMPAGATRAACWLYAPGGGR